MTSIDAYWYRKLHVSSDNLVKSVGVNPFPDWCSLLCAASVAWALARCVKEGKQLVA